MGFVVLVLDRFEFVVPEKCFQNSQAFCCAVQHLFFRRSARWCLCKSEHYILFGKIVNSGFILCYFIRAFSRILNAAVKLYVELYILWTI